MLNTIHINKVVYVDSINYKNILENSEDKNSTLISIDLTSNIKDVCIFAKSLGFLVISIKIKHSYDFEFLEVLKLCEPTLLKRIEYCIPRGEFFQFPNEQVIYLYKGEQYTLNSYKFLTIESNIKSILRIAEHPAAFALWDNCNQGCIFCGLTGNIYDTVGKRKAILRLKQLIVDMAFPIDLHLLGGELFNDKNLFDDWIDLASFLTSMIEIGKVNNVQLVSNLMVSEPVDLLNIISAFKQKHLEKHLSIMCSFDIAGRFKSQKEKFRFGRNFITLQRTGIHCFVNSVLTGAMCKWIINNLDKYFHYVKKINLQASPYGTDQVTDKELAEEEYFKKGCPTKDEVIKVLQLWKEYDINYLKSYAVKKIEYKDTLIGYDHAKCGHPVQSYSNNGECFFCLVNKILEG